MHALEVAAPWWGGKRSWSLVGRHTGTAGEAPKGNAANCATPCPASALQTCCRPIPLRQHLFRFIQHPSQALSPPDKSSTPRLASACCTSIPAST